MAEIDNDNKPFTITASLLKRAFDWSVALIPTLWFVFQFYSNQDRLAEKSKANEERIVKLEGEIKKKDEEISKLTSDAIQLRQQVIDDKEFYIHTRGK